MKRRLKLLIIIPIALGLYSCTSDNLEDYYGKISCEEADLTFNADIKPIIDANCAISGCHVTGTGLPSWQTYENVSANGSKIVAKTSAGEMPPSFSGKSLTIEQVQMIECWVTSGAPEN